MNITRRHILRAAAISASALVLPRAQAQNTRVLIAGAGPAGLSAAFELVQAGFDVQVFEASQRVGGRMHTLRTPFAGDLYAEAGAQFLGDTNPGVQYARAFGLKLVPMQFDPTLGHLAYLKGQRLEMHRDQPITLPFKLHADEQGKTVNGLHSMYRRSPLGNLKELPDLVSPNLPPGKFDHLDQKSLLTFWKEQGASEGAIEAMMLMYVRAYGDAPDDISLLQLARETASFTGMQGGFTIAGGNDNICRALADRLADRVHFGHRVVAAEHSESGVSLRIQNTTGQTRVQGDFAVLTPPPPVLKDISFQPALPEATMAALNAAEPQPVTMTYAQTGSRFWLDMNLDGSAITDLPVGQILHATGQQQQAEKGILSSMTYGNQARAMASLSAAAREQALRDALAKLYPKSLNLDAAGTSYAWGDDPFHRCGHVAFRPGTFAASLRALRQPHGRMLLAGDTIGGVSGYSHAAFASGQEVAQAIIESAA